MSGHILIQNAGELPIWGIRLMGCCEKTAQQIGQFGTGLKESLALLARLGIQPIIFSGELRVDFKVELMDTQEEICFKLSEARSRFEAGIWHGLGIHPNLGKHDWDDPWMIFREIVCNALDEGSVDELYHDVVYHEPEGKQGATRFYIPATKEMVEAYSTIESKLLPLGKVEIVSQATGIGRALAKRGDKPLQTFHRGVWIQAHKEESLFDYELDDIKLNESRSADWYDVNREIGIMVANYTEAQAKTLLHAIITENRDNLYELDVLSTAAYYVDSHKEAWQGAWNAMFGLKGVMTDSSQFYYDKLRKVGKDPIVVSHGGLTALLKNAGVPTVDKVLTQEQRQWDTVEEPTDEATKVFDMVWEMLAKGGQTNDAEKPKLRLFTELPGSTVVTFGSYANGTCFINKASVGSIQERRACVEEIGHHVTQATDCCKEFQMWLLEVLDYFAFEVYVEDKQRRTL